MAMKMDEEQMDFLGELLGDTPAVDEPKVEEQLQSEEQQTSEEPIEVQETQEVEESAQIEEPVEDVNALLREQIVKLTEQLQKDPFIQTVQEDVKKDEKTDKAPEKLTAFLSEDEIDRIIDEPQLLNTAFNRALNVMQQSMQGVIQAEVNRQVMVTRAVSDFYTSNKDLAPYSKFVQFVMSEVEQQNPQKTYAEIFDMTATESRKRLGLGGGKPSVERQQSRPDQQKPAFAGSKKSTSRPAPKQDFFDQNAADMFNLS
jgi:hypothetical protein